MWTYEWLSTSISFHKLLPIYADHTYSTLRQLNIFITASVILYEPLPTSSPLSPKETHLTLVNHLTSFNLCQSMVTSPNLSEIGPEWITWEDYRFIQIESNEIKLDLMRTFKITCGQMRPSEIRSDKIYSRSYYQSGFNDIKKPSGKSKQDVMTCQEMKWYQINGIKFIQMISHTIIFDQLTSYDINSDPRQSKSYLKMLDRKILYDIMLHLHRVVEIRRVYQV